MATGNLEAQALVDKDEVLKALRLLIPKGATTEIRALNASVDTRSWKRTFAGYFNDFERVAAPEDVSYEKPEPDVTRIHGYVEHKNYPPNATLTAHVLLALLFNRSRLWPMLAYRRYCMWSWHPLRIINAICYTIHGVLANICQRCNCGRRTWKRNVLICETCSREREAAWKKAREEVPF